MELSKRLDFCKSSLTLFLALDLPVTNACCTGEKFLSLIVPLEICKGVTCCVT